MDVRSPLRCRRWDRGQRLLCTAARAPCPQPLAAFWLPLAAAVASRLRQVPAFRPSPRSHRSPLDGRLRRSARERVLHFIIRPRCRAHLSQRERLPRFVHRVPLFPFRASSQSARTSVRFVSADSSFARSVVRRGAGEARLLLQNPAPRTQVPGGRGSGSGSCALRPSRPALHVLRPARLRTVRARAAAVVTSAVVAAACAGTVGDAAGSERSADCWNEQVTGRRAAATLREGRGEERRRGGRGRGDGAGLRVGPVRGERRPRSRHAWEKGLK